MESVIFEGPDGAGKNFAALQTMMELSLLGYNILGTNYPNYIFFGALVRLMNRGGADAVLDLLPPYEKARHRAAMYALDRALSILYLDDAIQNNPSAVHVSDRGPQSNAVTAAFIWANDSSLTDGDLQKFIIEEIGTMDAEFTQLMQPTTILCLEKIDKTKGVDHREVLDQLENQNVQERAVKIYEQILPNNILYTKVEGQWKQPQEIVSEIFSRIGKTQSTIKDNNRIKGEITLVGPKELASVIFKVIPEEILELDEKWRIISLNPVDVEGQRKIILDKMEMEISKIMSKYLGQIDNIKPDLSLTAIKAISRLLKAYPSLLEIIRACGGEDYANFLEFIIQRTQEA